MPAVMHAVLDCLCQGCTRGETAGRLYYSTDAIREMRQALYGIFRARNAAHLAALAVAQGYSHPLPALAENLDHRLGTT